jgi:Peptidase A4 family
MHHNSLVILGALAVFPAFAQVSNVSLLENPVKKINAPRHGPILGKLDHGNGTAEDTNWSGYAVLGSNFQSVKGSWTVPTSTCTGLVKAAAFWVGLDGYDSNTVEQTGTASECVLGIPIYYAWYEFYPANIVIVPIPVRPGDSIVASVVYDDTSSQFSVTVKNITRDKVYSKSAAVPGALRSSAEWIAEAPGTILGTILPLTDFGTISFGQDATGTRETNYATDESNSGPIGSFLPVNTIQITKVSSFFSPQTSTCSALSSDETSFTCTWASGTGPS